jgi:hypothetical protein
VGAPLLLEQFVHDFIIVLFSAIDGKLRQVIAPHELGIDALHADTAFVLRHAFHAHLPGVATLPLKRALTLRIRERFRPVMRRRERCEQRFVRRGGRGVKPGWVGAAKTAWKLAVLKAEFIIAPAIRAAGVPQEECHGTGPSGRNQTHVPSAPFD